MRKATRLAAPEGASGLCLTFLRNSIPASAATSALSHPSPAVFSPSLRADIMLTSSPTLDISSRSSLSLIYELHSLSFSLSLSRFSPTFSPRHLLTLTRPEAASPGMKTPSNCQNVTNPPLPREPGREGYQNGTRFRPSQRELSSSEPIPADNLFLSGLQSTRVPHEWDFG